MLEKWRKAVIHLECATNSEHIYDKIEKDNELYDKFKSGEISSDEFMKEKISIWETFRDIREWGTALFLSHNSKRYLITAGHVVFDKKSAERELEESFKWAEEYDEIDEYDENRIFDIIFRVPSLDETLSEETEIIHECLMNLKATDSYSFSSSECDLAIISLDNMYSRFADELERWHKPITLEDIGDEPTKEGTDVFTVGYPGSISKIATLVMNSAIKNWSSDQVSLPSFAFGKVSMLHKKLRFFWTDMSVYKGNSGSPVIENETNKLVGIVSGQPVEEATGITIINEKESKDTKTKINMGIPFGQIIKAEYVKELINIQIKKDKYIEEMLNR